MKKGMSILVQTAAMMSAMNSSSLPSGIDREMRKAERIERYKNHKANAKKKAKRKAVQKSRKLNRRKK